MLPHHIRPFVISDRDPCLAIFDSNTPTFFDASERADFETFLDRQREHYFVVEDDGRVVACGGWGSRTEHPRIALLCWGMVRRDRHRAGIGTALLTYRLAEIANGDFESIEMVTSQHSKGFFARAGFVEIDVRKDQFAPGLHGHTMRFAVPSRVLTWDGSANIRDLGNLPTAMNTSTRYGVIVRAGDLSTLTNDGRDEAARHGVRRVIDLRFPTEASRLADERFDYVNISLIDPGGADTHAIRASVQTERTYKMILDACGNRFVAVLESIGSAPPGGVAIHCAAGRDRTGLVAALILAVAGVPDDVIARDYAMSNCSHLGETAPSTETMRATLNYVRSTFGGVERYLQGHGATKQLLERVRARLA